MCTSLTSSFDEVEISRIRVPVKYHKSESKIYYIIGVCSDIVKNLLYGLVSGLSDGGLLLSKFAECY